MRTLRNGLPVGVVALCVIGGASAQQPGPKVIEIPVPQAEPMPGSPGSLDALPPPVPTVEVPMEPVGGRYRTPIRREQRAASGTPPTSLSGRWTVVQVTDLGTTEDFRIKMERAGKALDQSCILTGLVFDFGPPTGQAGFPGQLVLTQEEECDKGGLGRYLNSIAMTVAAGWSAEGGLTLTLPEARGSAAMIRLRVAEQAGRTPSQWVGPETELERAHSSYTLLAEAGKGYRADPNVPVALHLTEPSGRVFHLEPAP